MCLKNSETECVLRDQQEELKERVVKLDSRITQVEHDVGRMRSESQDGFRSINASLANLAHDFGERMTNLDKRIIEEKQAWGQTLRSIVLWTVRVVLAGCAVAMGVTAYRQLFAN